MRFYPGGSCPSIDDFKKAIVIAIELDDKRSFVLWMRFLTKYQTDEGDYVITKDFAMQLLKLICLHRAVKCATCLFYGNCRLDVVDDLNNVVFEEEGGLLKLTPLHLAARNLCYDLTKLFLLYGADPNLSTCDDDHKEKLPLCFALEALSNHQLLTNWSLDKLTFTLIYIFYLKEMAEPFDTLCLLASRTRKHNIEKIGLRYAEEGEIVKLTALLLVAGDTLLTPYAEQGVECSPIGKCIRKEIESLSVEEMNGQCSSKPESLHERKTKLEVAWKMLKLLGENYEGLNELRYGLHGPCAWENAQEVTNHEVPFQVAKSMGRAYNYDCLEDVFADLECLKPGLQPSRKRLLDEALQNQMCSGQASVWVPQFDPNSRSIVASLSGSNLGGIGYSHMARDVTQGSCLFHTSSVLKAKAHRGVAQSSQLNGGLVRKPHFWWNPSFLMKAFRRGIKHV